MAVTSFFNEAIIPKASREADKVTKKNSYMAVLLKLCSPENEATGNLFCFIKRLNNVKRCAGTIASSNVVFTHYVVIIPDQLKCWLV